MWKSGSWGSRNTLHLKMGLWPKSTWVQLRLYLFESGEKTVNVISGGAGVHGPLVFQDLLHDELAELFNVVESNAMPARKSVRQPGEDVVQLREFGHKKNPKGNHIGLHH